MASTSDAPDAPRRRRRGRWIAIALAVVVVLVVAAIAGGGWYFAGRIDAEALSPPSTPQPQSYDLRVQSYSGGVVVLRRTGNAPTPDPLRNATEEGLVWPGGTGVLSGAAQSRPGGLVSRTLNVSTGSPPIAGAGAALKNEVWGDPHEAYGVPFQQVSYHCAGGRCPAWFVPGTSSTWMVLVHGKGAPLAEPLRAMGPAIRAGMPVLDVGYRNDPGAPADPGRRYAYGATEWHDLDHAVRYASSRGARHVVLFGSSMGGAVVASFMEHSSSASLVTGVVLDAPALDLRAVVDFGATQRTVPGLGTPIPGTVTWAAEEIAALRFGLDWQQLDYVDADWLHVPALVFHGTADDTVPTGVSDRLHAAHPDLVQEVRVVGAGHVESWNVDPSGYSTRESAFLGCITAARQTSSCVTAG